MDVLALLVIIAAIIIGILIGLLNSNDKVNMILVLGLYIIHSICMPSNILDAANSSELVIVIAVLLWILLLGLIFGISIRFGLKIKLKDQTVFQKMASFMGAIIAIVIFVWFIKFLFDGFNMLSSIDPFEFFSNTPEIISISSLVLSVQILMALSVFGGHSDLNLNVDILSKANVSLAGGMSEMDRKAFVTLYKNNLKNLEIDVLSKKIKPQQYAQIICDIELDNYRTQEEESK